jgi:hypothetical protein
MQVFKDMIFLQRDLETSKVALAFKSDFNLMDAFAMLDIENTG